MKFVLLSLLDRKTVIDLATWQVIKINFMSVLRLRLQLGLIHCHSENISVCSFSVECTGLLLVVFEGGCRELQAVRGNKRKFVIASLSEGIRGSQHTSCTHGKCVLVENVPKCESFWCGEFHILT